VWVLDEEPRDAARRSWSLVVHGGRRGNDEWSAVRAVDSHQRGLESLRMVGWLEAARSLCALDGLVGLSSTIMKTRNGPRNGLGQRARTVITGGGILMATSACVGVDTVYGS